MNRAERRGRIRHIRRDLRVRFGCRCAPSIINRGVVGSVGELDVRQWTTTHVPECPLAGSGAVVLGDGVWARCGR